MVDSYTLEVNTGNASKTWILPSKDIVDDVYARLKKKFSKDEYMISQIENRDDFIELTLWRNSASVKREIVESVAYAFYDIKILNEINQWITSQVEKVKKGEICK